MHAAHKHGGKKFYLTVIFYMKTIMRLTGGCYKYEQETGPLIGIPRPF